MTGHRSRGQMAATAPRKRLRRLSYTRAVMWITIEGTDATSDVEVSTAGGWTGAEIAAAIRAELGLADSTPLNVARTGVALTAVEPGDLRDGDVILTGTDSAVPPRPPSIAELAIAGGPAMGRRLPLSTGVYTVGRGEHCDLTIDDESLSSLHLRVRVNGALEVEDANSTNGTFIDARPLAAGTPRTIEVGTSIELGRTLLRIDPPETSDPGGASDDGTIPFNRPPRVGRGAQAAAMALAAPPEKPDRARIPLAASLLPVIVGVVLWRITGSIVMLAFTALSPALALWSFAEQRHGGKRRYKRERAEFEARVQEASGDLAAGVDREARERRAASPDAAELLRRARARDPRLWERSPGDHDFLALRLGITDQPAETVVNVAAGGDEELQRVAEEALAPHRQAPAVPLTVALEECPVIGLCGAPRRVAGLARSLVLQAACLHSPRELAIAAVIDEQGRDDWSWLAWLPHARVPADLQDDGLFAIDPEASRALLERLIDLALERAASDRSARASGPALLVVIDERARLDRGLLAHLLESARDARMAVVWLGSDRRDLPGACDAVAELAADTSRLDLTLVDEGRQIASSADGVPIDIARAAARALAPIRDTSARRAGSEIPGQVMLLDLAGLEPISAVRVAERWSDRARGAPIGATADGVFRFDPRVDGPHALIAGTTGSGKSELLQTLVCSLAVTYPPNRMSFLLIDYKGGAAFRECEDLPHVVGLVTSLDGHLTQRALVAMNAELLKRERDVGGHKDLVTMEQVAPEAAPARLMIVVDEFATLVKEVPDFIDGVINVAQRGRSLGIHLVLATQRPSGVISPAIRANTDLRIALRTSDEVESGDVIDSPLAGRISRERAGRAFARTGQRLFELQTAYVGARQSRTQRRRVSVRRLNLGGRIDGDARRGEAESAASSEPTDLRLIVDAVNEAASESGIAPPPSPWLDPLPELLPLEELARRAHVKDPAATPLIGLLDEPAQQRQEPFALDLETDGHVLIYGTSGSGKTTFLRTLAASLAGASTPDTLHIYGLDCATRGLGVIECLPQVGGVVASDDVARSRRLLEHAARVIDQRKRDFASVSASSLSEYRRITGVETPRVVVLLDDYAGFQTAFERVDGGWLVSALPGLLGEGRPLGVHFVITAALRNAVPQSLVGLIQRRIVLRLASENDYDMVGLGRKVVGDASLTAGRGFLLDGRELQLAVLGNDASGDGQAAALARLGAAIAKRSGDGRPPAITVLPREVQLEHLPRATQPLEAIVGLDEEGDVAAVSLSDSHMIITGPYRSGRSTSLAAIVRSLAESTPECELYLFAPRRSPLSELGVWAEKATSREACDAAIRTLAERLAAGALSPQRPTIIVVDGAEDMGDAGMAHPLDGLARAGRDAGVRIVAACERQTAQRAFSGWLAEVRKDEQGLLLDPDVDTDGQIVGARLPRRSSVTFSPGRGYLVRRGEAVLVQVGR